MSSKKKLQKTTKVLTEQDAKAIYAKGESAVCEVILELQQKLVEAEGKNNKNSTNSSKPSSSDIAKKGKNNSREKTGRKSGGQVGHKGTTLSAVESPDHVVECEAGICGCGHHFGGDEKVIKTTTRQVFDIPKPSIEVTEYRSNTYLCPGCGKRHKSAFPDFVNAPVQYGPNLSAHIVYLMNYQLLPYKRTTELVEATYGITISQGTLKNILKDFGSRIEKPLEAIKQNIINAPTAHFDESGLYVDKKRNWLHVASTAGFTYYFHHKSRGKIATDAAGILPNFTGNALHDNWSTYFRYKAVLHWLCNAHHLRELQGIYDTYGYDWSSDMKAFLKKAKKAVDKAQAEGKDHLPAKTIRKLEKEYDQIIARGYEQTPLPPEKEPGQKQVKKGKAWNLLVRLDRRKKEVLGFINDFAIPFDNNQAERDIRMIKVKQKISGTFRNQEMAQNFCDIRSYVSSALKHGLNIFETMTGVYSNKFFVSC